MTLSSSSSSSSRLTLVASFLLLILPLAQLHETNGGESRETGKLLRRIMRDVSGKYRPELHGDHHSIHVENRGNLGQSQLVSSSFSSNSLGEGEGHHHSSSVGASTSSHSSGSNGHAHGSAVGISGSNTAAWAGDSPTNSHHATLADYLSWLQQSGISLPPATLPESGFSGYSYPSVIPPGIEANCGCQQVCGESTLAYTNAVLQAGASTLVCGRAFRVCCYDEEPAWPGVTDSFRDVIACVPREDCVREYGTVPTDVGVYGAIPPCPGHGAVRCLDGKVQIVDTQLIPSPSGPTHFVIPILEPVQPQPSPAIPTPVAPVFNDIPPTTYDAPRPTPPEPIAPIPVPVPTPTYTAPVPVAPVPVAPVPVAPVPVPLTSYGPPSGSYEAPAPVPIPEPTVPVPITTYDAPVAVPITTYDAPVAVAVPEPTYGVPSAVPEPPQIVPPIPATSYGVPGLAAGAPLGLNRGLYSPGLYSRLGGGFNNGLGFGGRYPGFGGFGGYGGGLGFRKHFSINKNFGFFG